LVFSGNLAERHIASTITAAVAAILTIAQAVPNIDKRLSRLRDIEREIGRLPQLIGLYAGPQFLYKYGLIGITLLGIFMVGLFGYTVLFPTASLHPWLATLKDNGIWLAGVWLLLGAAMYTNAFSRILIWGWRALAWAFPIRAMLDIYRPVQHPAWTPLVAFVELNENAKPLFASANNAAAFADWLIRTIRQEVLAPPNRASPPARPQGAHYRSSGFPARNWGSFYEAIGEVAIQSNRVSAAVVREQHFQGSYHQSLLTELNERLSSRHQPLVPQSAALMEVLRKNFGMIAEHYDGTAAAIDPKEDGWAMGRAEIITARVNRLPFWDDEGIRAQFVKLAIVWNVWNDFSEFNYPFAKGIATLLLDRSVIQTTEEIKVLSFDEPNDRMLASAAEKMVVSEAIRLIETDLSSHQDWLPAQSLNTAGEVLRWWIAYELDFRMWDFARRLIKGQTVADDPGLTRWQLSFGQVVRVKK
jgi:hypothetical protein